MFDFLFDVVAGALAWFYSLWPSFGMSIVFLTLAALLVITPLTLKGTKSMLQMQQYQPEVKRIQSQHRGDPQARNEAMMAFYKEKGVNPMGSCVPLLAQAPIFIVLYQVVRGLTRRTTEIGTQLGFTAWRNSVEAAPEATTVLRNEQTFDPDFLSVDTQLYQRLNQETEMVSWGIDLSRSASEAMGEGIFQALPYLLMMLMVLVTGLIQHRQIQRRQIGTGQPPQMQLVMKLLPWFLPIISYSFQAALVVYFIVSNLYRIGQQAYITRTLYSKEDSLGAVVARQRSAAQNEPDDDEETSGRSRTQPKGTATPKRDGDRSQKSQRPTRVNRSSGAGSKSRGSGGGRTGKAPTRSRGGGGRVTPSGASQNRTPPNRSKKKRKRR